MSAAKPGVNGSATRWASRVRLLAVVSAAALHAGPSLPQEPGPTGFANEEVVAFATALQAAVATDKAREVARFVAFPLRVNTGPDRTRLVSRRQFVRDYARIITPTVKMAVIRQDVSEIHQGWRGAMFGKGQLWFAGVCDDEACSRKSLKVIAVNLNAQ